MVPNGKACLPKGDTASYDLEERTACVYRFPHLGRGLDRMSDLLNFLRHWEVTSVDNTASKD